MLPRMDGGPYRASGSGHIRNMVHDPENTSHQQLRTSCCVAGSRTIPSCCVRSERNDLDGQHNSCVLHSETRGDSFSNPVQRDLEITSLVPRSQSDSVSQTLTRSHECVGRQTLSLQQSSACRVVSQTTGDPLSVSTARPTHGRSVCNSLESQASTLCIPSPRRESMGYRCTISQLESPSRVCLPTFSIRFPRFSTRSECHLVGSC